APVLEATGWWLASLHDKAATSAATPRNLAHRPQPLEGRAVALRRFAERNAFAAARLLPHAGVAERRVTHARLPAARGMRTPARGLGTAPRARRPPGPTQLPSA